MCKKKQIKLILFINPISTAQATVLDITNNKEYFNEWKYLISQTSSFYDFSTVNYITSESIEDDVNYYFDSNHYTEKVGNQILDRFYNNKKLSPKNEFGILINKSNVKQISKLNNEKLNNWKNKNTNMLYKINLLKNW